MGMIINASKIPSSALTCGGIDLALRPIMAINIPLIRINGNIKSAKNWFIVAKSTSTRDPSFSIRSPFYPTYISTQQACSADIVFCPIF